MAKLAFDDIQSILTSRFKDDTIKELSHLPNSNNLKDVKKAAKKIIEYKNRGEKITILGDYDVDGVTSSCILSEFFDDIGIDYEVIIPNRFKDGYGLSANSIKKVTTKLIVTVDNGISAVNSAQLCKELGIELIITDHHKVPEVIPEAYAIVNPKQEDCKFEFKDICGAQVSWYLAAAIKEELQIPYKLGKFFDLLAIAITADMMPLVGLNRVMVKNGLKTINSSSRPFILAIKQIFHKYKITGDDLSFLFSPLINSSGRMDDAIHSFNMIKSPSIELAHVNLLKVVDFNNMRKDTERIIKEQALEMVGTSSDNIIIVHSQDWHEGVIGIVASRLSRAFKKPAIVFAVRDGIAKGSARSVGNIDIYSLISRNSKTLIGFGGHKGAAGLGLKIEDMDSFKEAITKDANSLNEKDFISLDDRALGEIKLDEIDHKLLDLLEEYEPYGVANPKPVFDLCDVKISNSFLIGKEKNHQKCLVHGNSGIEVIEFNFKEPKRVDDIVNLKFHVSKNEFRGEVKPNLILI